MHCPYCAKYSWSSAKYSSNNINILLLFWRRLFLLRVLQLSIVHLTCHYHGIKWLLDWSFDARRSRSNCLRRLSSSLSVRSSRTIASISFHRIRIFCYPVIDRGLRAERKANRRFLCRNESLCATKNGERRCRENSRLSRNGRGDINW